MYIIPAIDIIEGKCVRLSQGAYDRKTIYHDDPLEVAKSFADHGLTRLHLVDLDGAKAKHVVNWKVLERIANYTDLQIDFGGGVKSNEDLKIVFDSGARQATAGSIAVTEPDVFHGWLQSHGSEKIILGADLKNGNIATHGWQNESDHGWESFLDEHTSQGATYVVCTDVAKDGMLAGPATDLYRDMLVKFPDLKLIASGGVTTLSDLEELRTIGCYGAIVGKAIYEEKLSLKDLQNFQDAG